VVDEFQDLLADKATRQAFLDGVKRLGAKARAAGIHLVCATQRPDKSTVPGEIKANLNGRIALRVQAQVNSRIILDRGGAELLLGKGDLLADLGHGVVRAQAPMA
jgi:S-DNA-T family DNA segregation ATPase FtsK/SpoIIIE